MRDHAACARGCVSSPDSDRTLPCLCLLLAERKGASRSESRPDAPVVVPDPFSGSPTLIMYLIAVPSSALRHTSQQQQQPSRESAPAPAEYRRKHGELYQPRERSRAPYAERESAQPVLPACA